MYQGWFLLHVFNIFSIMSNKFLSIYLSFLTPPKLGHRLEESNQSGVQRKVMMGDELHSPK